MMISSRYCKPTHTCFLFAVYRKRVYSPSAPQVAHAGEEDERTAGMEGTLFAGQVPDKGGFRLKLA